MEKPETNIPVMRHFDDIDDLLNFGRDSDLIPGQEESATPVAKEIYSKVLRENKSAVMFVCSGRKRAVQTAGLVADKLEEMDNNLKIRIVAEERLEAIDQGKFILPVGYKPGEPFPGLSLANKVFSKEVFGLEKGNYLYKFGDPVLLDDGSYKYPELLPYFESYGENNRDFLLRIYELVVETYHKLDKLSSKTEVVVVTHAQLYQILRDLSTVAEMVKKQNLTFATGKLPELCWKLYSERFKNEKPSYNTNYISIENLGDPDIIQLLNREIEYLKDLK